MVLLMNTLLPVISQLTPAIRSRIYDCLTSMVGGGGTVPWRQINNVFNSSAKQLIVLSDGEAWPSDLYARNTSWHNYYGVYFQTSEWGRRYGYLPGVYNDYNRSTTF